MQVDTFKCTYLKRLGLSITATSYERQNFLTSLQAFEQGGKNTWISTVHTVLWANQTLPIIPSVFASLHNGYEWSTLESVQQETLLCIATHAAAKTNQL
jgi:hypothetical protein